MTCQTVSRTGESGQFLKWRKVRGQFYDEMSRGVHFEYFNVNFRSGFLGGHVGHYLNISGL